MADRFCIASGNYGDTAVWSATDGGVGGASVPGVGDDLYFNKSGLTVAEFLSPATNNRNLFVGKGASANLSVRNDSPGISLGFGNGYSMKVDGTLCYAGRTTTDMIAFSGTARCRIESGGKIDMTAATLALYSTAVLENYGTISNSGSAYGSVFLYGGVDNSANRHRIGTVSSLSISHQQSSFKAAFRDRLTVAKCTISPVAGGSMSLLFEDTVLEFGKLDFSTAAGSIILSHDGPLSVSGDLGRTGIMATTTWTAGSNATLTFTGAADQVVNMPPGVTGQTWIVDKPFGKLDLQQFNGYLMGRLRSLVVQASSSIDLSGAPPYLLSEYGQWACCHGLVGDVSPEPPATIEEHLFQSIDSCENYGLITIPAGKTICSKTFKNMTGARVAGNGTLCIRHGGLTNLGTIAPSVSIRYFDWPFAVKWKVADTALTNIPFALDFSESRGCLFRVDWQDGTVSETTTPGTLSHVYTEEQANKQLMLTLTVENEDGLKSTAYISIRVMSSQVAVRPIVTPSAGRAPLAVGVSTYSENAGQFTYAWGNGHITGPTDSTTAEYVYYEPGYYNILVTTTNAAGGSGMGSCRVTVLPPASLPVARLSISPWQGTVPLQIDAVADGSQGSEMLLDWGDGSIPAGPMSGMGNVSHIYDEAGRYLVKLKVWNEDGKWAEASQVVRALDPSEIRSVLNMLPSTGYAPLTVLADASESDGSEFTFTWGDGTTDGPQSEPTRTHTYELPGYYTVTLSVLKDGLTLSATKGVVVLLSPLISTDSNIPSPLGPVEIQERKKYCGIPRGNMPSPYRLTLAQGIYYMNDALQLFCPMSENGRALENGNSLFLGRIGYPDGRAVAPSEIAFASYTIFRLDDSDAGVRVPVEGHADVPLDITDILLPSLVVDANWKFDETGYNFRHVLDDSIYSPFPKAGRNYLVAYTLHLQTGGPDILVQYRVRVV